MIALRLYWLLPRRFRLRLIEFLPPHRQLWLVRRLIHLPVARRRTPAGQRRRARDAGRALSATVALDATPAQLWQRNLDFVVAALGRADVPYFCVPHADDSRSAVAVPARCRAEAGRALRAAARQTGQVVEAVTVAGRRARGGRGDILRVFAPVTDPAGATVLGRGLACEVEFWQRRETPPEQPDVLVAPRPNRVAGEVPVEGPPVEITPERLTRFLPREGQATVRAGVTGPVTYRSRSEFAAVRAEDVTFGIDVVYTWVDGADRDWQLRKNAALEANGQEPLNAVAANASRYVSRDELRYSLRSLVANVPWVRRIFLVTDDQIPAWLDPHDPMVTVVPHRQIFGDTGTLPTFNSHAIESRLHRIPGLAEHLIYVNDDMFFGRPLLPTAFFHANGLAKFFPSPAQLDVGPATVYDAPVTAAGKNNRRHVERRFGRTITQKMRHVPYPLLRSVLEEIADGLPAEVLGTADHQFRHPGDLSIPSSLHHYWAFLSQRSVPGRIRYTYADLAHPSTPAQLAFLLARRHCDVFCLNDTDSAEVSVAEQHAMLAEFLPAYFPFRAPFELPDEVAAERSRLTSSQLFAQAYGAPAHDPGGVASPVRVPRQAGAPAVETQPA